MKRLVRTLLACLDAYKVISAIIVAKGGKDMADAHGMTKDFIEVPDWQSRLKAVDIGLKLKDKYPAERHQHSSELTPTYEERLRRLRGERAIA
jgi:hypothetical protein